MKHLLILFIIIFCANVFGMEEQKPTAYQRQVTQKEDPSGALLHAIVTLITSDKDD